MTDFLYFDNCFSTYLFSFFTLQTYFYETFSENSSIGVTYDKTDTRDPDQNYN